MASSSSNNEFFNSQLEQFIRTMENDGLLDSNFVHARALKDDNGPFFFAELIPPFCRDMQTALTEMEHIMGQPATDFRRLFEICIKTKGSAACFGISRLKNAIDDLKVAAKNCSKERCVSFLNVVKNEYNTMHEKLETVLQLERRTLTHRGAEL